MASSDTKTRKSYVVWNNKGGVGKTTLVFHLATEYAILHPKEYVVVVDMCPQANISAALLSQKNKNDTGRRGDEIVQSLAKKSITLVNDDGEHQYEQNICGYLMAKDNRVMIEDYQQFLVQPYEKGNKDVPENLFLLCGDHYLEIVSRALEETRGRGNINGNHWKRTTLLIKTFIEKVEEKLDKSSIFFIDTNPAFTVYTEIAVSAARNIIVPIMADDFSRTSVEAMFDLIYGILPGQPRYESLRQDEYAQKAKQVNLEKPKIYLVINNKVTPYNLRSAKAFSAKGEEIKNDLDKIQKNNKDIFAKDTTNHLFGEIFDFHTAAVHCLHLGCPLSMLPSKIDIGMKKNIPVNHKQLQPHKQKLTDLVELL